MFRQTESSELSSRIVLGQPFRKLISVVLVRVALVTVVLTPAVGGSASAFQGRKPLLSLDAQDAVALEFSKDGEQLVILESHDKQPSRIQRIEVKTGKRLQSKPLAPLLERIPDIKNWSVQGIRQRLLSKDGRRLVVVGSDEKNLHHIVLFDLEQQAWIRVQVDELLEHDPESDRPFSPRCVELTERGDAVAFSVRTIDRRYHYSKRVVLNATDRFELRETFEEEGVLQDFPAGWSLDPITGWHFRNVADRDGKRFELFDSSLNRVAEMPIEGAGHLQTLREIGDSARGRRKVVLVTQNHQWLLLEQKADRAEPVAHGIADTTRGANLQLTGDISPNGRYLFLGGDTWVRTPAPAPSFFVVDLHADGKARALDYPIVPGLIRVSDDGSKVAIMGKQMREGRKVRVIQVWDLERLVE